ncbi:MAG: ubiquinone biosynthesis regulatory protein kinase UbiB [Legionellales bacterium]|nr:ubiquinone biosynthesis regulatory protein kinase UbiB [Legionellales bacterium]
MNPIRKMLRLLYIYYIFSRHGIDEIVLEIKWFAPLRFLAFLNPWYYTRRKLNRGTRIRIALEELGPIFVKFGQMLSTRRDLIPEDIADELALLQDQVPPFSTKIVHQILNQVYQQQLEELFLDFSSTPLASASIAQVHSARLASTGTEVVIKILRPGIKKIIKRDLALMYSFAKLIEQFFADGTRLRPREVVAEFERCLLDELDCMREAANASQLRRNFLHSPSLYVPEVYWNYVRPQAFVMERVYGIRISDIAELKKQHINLKKLAERGVEIFFTQVFRDCFFHADMHPGNIFVSPDKPNDPQYIAIDFGIVGTLSRNDQRYLAENFLAFFKRDYRRVAELHVESGWIPYHTRVDEFEAAIRTVCEPIFDKPLKDISCGNLLLRLFQTARRFNMEIQPQLVLLQKTLLNIEGLGRQLYPELDLWNTAKPFLEHWLHKQVGVRATVRKLREQMPFWLEKLPEVPDLLYDAMQYVRDKKHQTSLVTLEVLRHEKLLRRQRKRSFIAGIGLSLITVALVTIGIDHHVFGLTLSPENVSWCIATVGLALLAYFGWKK